MFWQKMENNVKLNENTAFIIATQKIKTFPNENYFVRVSHIISGLSVQYVSSSTSMKITYIVVNN